MGVVEAGAGVIAEAGAGVIAEAKVPLTETHQGAVLITTKAEALVAALGEVLLLPREGAAGEMTLETGAVAEVDPALRPPAVTQAVAARTCRRQSLATCWVSLV